MNPSFFSKILPFYGKESVFFKAIKHVTGIKPGNLSLYEMAFRHESFVNDRNNSYERLEYLGDAILGAVVAEYLFKKFPFKEEGFLTEIRSRLVNRESMNVLAKKIGIQELIVMQQEQGPTHRSMFGDSLEALIGAVFLDKGFKKSKKFIIKRLIESHFDLNNVIENNTNYKSIIIEWAQKNGKNLRFSSISEKNVRNGKEFSIEVRLDEETAAIGFGPNKKVAEQNASFKLLTFLELI